MTRRVFFDIKVGDAYLRESLDGSVEGILRGTSLLTVPRFRRKRSVVFDFDMTAFYGLDRAFEPPPLRRPSFFPVGSSRSRGHPARPHRSGLDIAEHRPPMARLRHHGPNR